jgi:hypothetical protein
MKLFLIICVVFLLVVPIILQYIYGWGLFFWIDNKSYNISVYGFYLLGYMILQFLFAILNNKLKEVDNSGDVINKVNMMIVGNKEDPLYYRMCLESILNVCVFINSPYLKGK